MTDVERFLGRFAAFGAHPDPVPYEDLFDPTDGTVLPRLGGRVIQVDVGLARFYGGRNACLILEGGKAFTLHRGERLELPDDSRPELLRYLERAARLDPAPSPLEARISELRRP